MVPLAATPAAGAAFVAWGGACAGTSACNVTLSSDQNATATFKSMSPLNAPVCTLAPKTNKVRLATKKGKRSKIVTGTVKVTIGCDQSATLTVSGILTEVVGKKRERGKQRTAQLRLAAVTASVKAGAPETLVLKLPRGALNGLKDKRHESLVLGLIATDANGTGHATARIQSLRTA
jgi:hypothetical protein